MPPDFMKENPDIKVKPIYAGSYVDTADQGGHRHQGRPGPATRPHPAVDAYSLVDDELIVPFDSVATSARTRRGLPASYPAFMANGNFDGHVWGLPFQRSTIVAYYNKDASRKPGSIPRNPPPPGSRMPRWRRS